jgi:hypothetical protein
MKDNYTPGQDCQCHAYSEAECGCDVDWTSKEVYDLREQRDRLVNALIEARYAMYEAKEWIHVAKFEEATERLVNWENKHTNYIFHLIKGNKP